jgi:hypothetical protein
MFWDKGKNRKSEPNLKSRFVVQFGDPFDKLIYLVKTIDLPSLNIDFERAHANEYVHYFQNGQINWEPINITLHDYRIDPQITTGDLPQLKSLLFVFLTNNDINNENRTRIIEQPVFCQNIKIIPITSIVKGNYLAVSNLTQVLPGNQVYATNTDPRLTEKKLSDGLFKNDQFTDGFEIIKPRFSKINFGSYDYGSDEINTISLTVVPEWVQLNSSTSNVSSVSPRSSTTTAAVARTRFEAASIDFNNSLLEPPKS